MGATARHRPAGRVLRDVPGDFPAVPFPADWHLDAEGLRDRLLLSCQLGPALRHPAHVRDEQGGQLLRGNFTYRTDAIGGRRDHGRDAIGIDIDERNAELARDRVGPLLLTVEHLADGDDRAAS